MKFSQEVLTGIQQAYCVGGISPRRIADQFDTNREKIRWLITQHKWIKGKVIPKEKTKQIRKRMPHREFATVNHRDRGVRLPKGEWPAEARFDRPGMIQDFKVKLAYI